MFAQVGAPGTRTASSWRFRHLTSLSLRSEGAPSSSGAQLLVSPWGKPCPPQKSENNQAATVSPSVSIEPLAQQGLHLLAVTMAPSSPAAKSFPDTILPATLFVVPKMSPGTHPGKARTESGPHGKPGLLQGAGSGAWERSGAVSVLLSCWPVALHRAPKNSPT